MTAQRQRGSIIIYILIAIFLTGLLVEMMTQGATKSASSSQINAMVMELHADIKTIHAAVDECPVIHSAELPGTPTNSNKLWPMYCADSTCNLSTMTDGGGGNTGTTLQLVGCPGAPAGEKLVFPDSVAQNLQLLDSSAYNVTYISNDKEGILLRITPAASDPLWLDAMDRLDSDFSKCSAAAVKANPDPLGADCSGGCFYYWILRKSTSATGFEAGCPS